MKTRKYGPDPKPDSKKEFLAFRVSGSWKREVEIAARHLGVNGSEFARIAIAHYIHNSGQFEDCDFEAVVSSDPVTRPGGLIYSPGQPPKTIHDWLFRGAKIWEYPLIKDKVV